MAMDWFDTGNHGITLGLEYGSLVDAVTGGPITADSTSCKISNLEAWIKTDNWTFTDNSNQLTCAGAMVVDDSWSNISAGTSSSKKLKELAPQTQQLNFGAPRTGTVQLTLTGIDAADETLSGSRTFDIPARPYHAPAAPWISISENIIHIGGNQVDPYSDSFWEALYVITEINDVWQGWVWQTRDTTQKHVAMEANSRYRGGAYAYNANATGGQSYTNYYYTAPPAPAALSAARNLGSTTVSLSWNGNGGRYISAYRVYRSLNGGAYSHIFDVGVPSASDTVPLGSVASYIVRAISHAGVNQVLSADSSAVAIDAGYNVPNAPTVTLARTSSTTATITIAGNQNTATNDRYTATLDWELQVNGAAFGGGAADLAGNTSSITVSGLPADSQILVRARFGNASGKSTWAQSGYLYTTPDAPSAFVAARADAASSTVNLSWVDNAAYETNLLLEKKVGTGAWSQVVTFSAGATSGTVTQSQAEAASYRLRAVTTDNQYSDYSNEQSVDVAFVTNKTSLRCGTGVLDYCYVGGQRIRRICKGPTVLWEDGDA